MTDKESTETVALSLKLDGTLQDMDARTVLSGGQVLGSGVSGFRVCG